MGDGPSAEEIAKAIVKEQTRAAELAAAKSGTATSDALAWGGVLVVAPLGAAMFWLGLAPVGTVLCAVAPIMVVIGAIVGSSAKAKQKAAQK